MPIRQLNYLFKLFKGAQCVQKIGLCWGETEYNESFTREKEMDFGINKTLCLQSYTLLWGDLYYCITCLHTLLVFYTLSKLVIFAGRMK